MTKLVAVEIDMVHGEFAIKLISSPNPLGQPAQSNKKM